jgi:hypothetical protein
MSDGMSRGTLSCSPRPRASRVPQFTRVEDLMAENQAQGEQYNAQAHHIDALNKKVRGQQSPQAPGCTPPPVPHTRARARTPQTAQTANLPTNHPTADPALRGRARVPGAVFGGHGVGARGREGERDGGGCAGGRARGRGARATGALPGCCPCLPRTCAFEHRSGPLAVVAAPAQQLPIHSATLSRTRTRARRSLPWRTHCSRRRARACGRSGRPKGTCRARQRARQRSSAERCGCCVVGEKCLGVRG